MTHQLLVTCCLLGCAIVLPLCATASTLPAYDWACVIEPREGVSVGMYKTVDTSAFSFGMRSNLMDEAIRSGRAPWAKFIAENPGVYVVMGVYIDGEAELTVTKDSRFEFEYTDIETGAVQRFLSADILLRRVDLARNEERLFDVKSRPVVLRDDNNAYDRSERGGFKLYVRFLSLPHGRRYGYGVPDVVRFVEGGEGNDTHN